MTLSLVVNLALMAANSVHKHRVLTHVGDVQKAYDYHCQMLTYVGHQSVVGFAEVVKATGFVKKAVQAVMDDCGRSRETQKP
ncbi:hypothetical protein H310_13634 [Aphanomyces invadans]|uniref:Uncharacterized protein n=1 Tax=Aphanomyces invadans TaxID=157072 RepID=A0A024TCP5_9STRA|nr:hypothetical protein H310_13634 [Aphanomyces invadans]ETV91789.1 hypothetical protein H310_13634 [Aphanomyces invadans]|eukprot:XP_008879426.1 hypothetical protein H310_13634 [Aphanomyces invadans]